MSPSSGSDNPSPPDQILYQQQVVMHNILLLFYVFAEMFLLFHDPSSLLEVVIWRKTLKPGNSSSAEIVSIVLSFIRVYGTIPIFKENQPNVLLSLD